MSHKWPNSLPMCVKCVKTPNMAHIGPILSWFLFWVYLHCKMPFKLPILKK